MIDQSSADPCCNTPNRLTKRAPTNTVVATKVTMVTMKTASPRESPPETENIELALGVKPAADVSDY
jgi:hypothetical protein